MLNNYQILENGVIKQIKKNHCIEYNCDYVNNSYNAYGELGPRMAHLRLGYLLGSLKFTPISILDVGYGNGDFLKTSSTIIKNCFGHDISGYPLPKNIQFIENIYVDQYDVVTFFDVLEHFDDIYNIKNIKTKYFVISLPYCHNFNDEWFENWKHRRPNEHLWHFNEESLISFMKEIGFELINCSNIEDTIRTTTETYPNILTGVFKNTKIS